MPTTRRRLSGPTPVLVVSQRGSVTGRRATVGLSDAGHPFQADADDHVTPRAWHELGQSHHASGVVLPPERRPQTPQDRFYYMAGREGKSLQTTENQWNVPAHTQS